MTEPIAPSATDLRTALRQANRLIVVLALLLLASLLALVWMWQRGEAQELDRMALQDPTIRRQVVARLALDKEGFYDSHVDADVGRTSIAELSGFVGDGIDVETNRFGMRERNYAMPKPPGTVRIVMLGDSFVFGIGVEADERMGAYLEQELRARSPYRGEIEVLHLGVASWNFINEEAFLRRQLSELQPDVVLQLSLPNDIEDGVGVRGVGVWARFSPQLPERADSVLDAGFPVATLGFKYPGYVRHGIDYEGQQRYADAVTLLTGLQGEIEKAGGKYRLLMHFRQLLQPAYKYLGRQMPAGVTYYISKDFGNDRRYWVDRSDHHWNRLGHLRVSRMLYELLRRDALVPQLELPEWDKASREFQAIAEHGRGEAEQRERSEQQLLDLLNAPPIGSAIDFRRLDDASAAQVHTGIDADRLLSPYASFVLAQPPDPPALQLKIRGRMLQRPELDGAKVEIFIDEEVLEVLEITSDEEVDLSLPIPPSVIGRPFSSIRFSADDYVYHGTDFQHCVVFRLDSIALETGPKAESRPQLPMESMP